MDGCHLEIASEWLRYQVRETVGLKGRIKEKDKFTVKNIFTKVIFPCLRSVWIA